MNDFAAGQSGTQYGDLPSAVTAGCFALDMQPRIFERSTFARARARYYYPRWLKLSRSELVRISAAEKIPWRVSNTRRERARIGDFEATSRDDTQPLTFAVANAETGSISARQEDFSAKCTYTNATEVQPCTDVCSYTRRPRFRRPCQTHYRSRSRENFGRCIWRFGATEASMNRTRDMPRVLLATFPLRGVTFEESRLTAKARVTAERKKKLEQDAWNWPDSSDFRGCRQRVGYAAIDYFFRRNCLRTVHLLINKCKNIFPL